LQEQKKQADAQKQQPATVQPARPVSAPKTTTARKTSSAGSLVMSSAMRQIGREAGKALVRGLFGNKKF